MLLLNLIGSPGANKLQIANQLVKNIDDCIIIDVERVRKQSSQSYIGEYYEDIRDRLSYFQKGIIVSTGLSAGIRMLTREHDTLTILCLTDKVSAMRRIESRNGKWLGKGSFGELFDICNKSLTTFYPGVNKVFSDDIEAAANKIQSLLKQGVVTEAPLVNESAAKRAAKWKRKEIDNRIKAGKKSYYNSNTPKNEHRVNAIKAVNEAIKKGKLIRPTICGNCGKKAKLEAHHWSYKPENWLDVTWLCQECHKAVHR